MAEVMKLKDFESLSMKDREAIMEAGAKLTPDPTEKMALEDIRARDTDNLELSVFKKLYEFRCDSMAQAMGFIADRQRLATKRFGINTLDIIQAKVKQQGKGFRDSEFLGKRLDAEMRKKGIKMEYRAPSVYLKNRPSDVWKSGFYFYKDNEIAYFISSPMKVKYNRNNIVIPGRTEFMVLTNVSGPKKGEA